MTLKEKLKLLFTSPLHKMLVKEINDDLVWLANEREREREREVGLRPIESKFRENVAKYQGDINPQNETSAQIAQFLKDRNITTLLHFTDRKNLFKILTYGLLSRKILDDLQWNYNFNDTVRADWRTDCISLSISKINEYLLNHFINKQTIKECVIVLIDATMLYRENNKRIYCQTNGATKNAKKGSEFKDLQAMFDDEVSYCTSSKPRVLNRQAQNKKDNETTDLQAEILWADWVNPNYINGYYLNNQFYHNENQHKEEQIKTRAISQKPIKTIESRKIIIVSKGANHEPKPTSKEQLSKARDLRDKILHPSADFGDD